MRRLVIAALVAAVVATGAVVVALAVFDDEPKPVVKSTGAPFVTSRVTRCRSPAESAETRTESPMKSSVTRRAVIPGIPSG